MGELLSARDVIRSIDQRGNQDGIATLEDIRPALDDRQAIFLGNPNTDLYKALQTLNQICGLPTDAFHMAAILSCPVIQHNKIYLNKLHEAEKAFVKTQFDRAFNNKNSDDVVRTRYKEFLSFVETNHIPFSALFNVLQNVNYFTEPLENVVSKELFFSEDQKTCLVQLSLYAALWHLKYNIKAFSPEELDKYPEWFRKKVEGFEDNILKRIKRWELKPKLGDTNVHQPIYKHTTQEIVTPSYAPFPSILTSSLLLIWHECFHAYRSQQVDVEPMWIAERDATLVAGVAYAKMNGITDPKDKRLKKMIWDLTTEMLGNQSAKKEVESNFYDFWITYLYAFCFYLQRKKEMAHLDPKIEEVFARNVISNAVPSLSLLLVRLDRQHEIILQKKREDEKQIRLIEERVYAWPPENESNQKISFRQMLKELNLLISKQFSEGMKKEDYQKILPYLAHVYSYMNLLLAIDIYDTILRHLNAGLAFENWPPLSIFHDFPTAFRFQRENKWVFFFKYFP